MFLEVDRVEGLWSKKILIWRVFLPKTIIFLTSCMPTRPAYQPTLHAWPCGFVSFPSRTPPPNSRSQPWPSAARSVSCCPEAAGLPLFLPWISRWSSPSWPWRGEGRGGDRDGHDARPSSSPTRPSLYVSACITLPCCFARRPTPEWGSQFHHWIGLDLCLATRGRWRPDHQRHLEAGRTTVCCGPVQVHVWHIGRVQAWYRQATAGSPAWPPACFN
jgi:hypothetical protein